MKQSYGSVPHGRLRRIIEALVSFAEEGKNGFLHRQFSKQVTIRKGKMPNLIFVKTSPTSLAELTNAYEQQHLKDYLKRIESWHVTEALKHLETTLGILSDRRKKRQGSRLRHFSLQFWHVLSDTQSNFEEIALRWPTKETQPLLVPSPSSCGDNHYSFSQNQDLLHLVATTSQPLTWQQFAIAVGLLDGSEHQVKQLLAETCVTLLDNPPSAWKKYLYQFTPFHLLNAGQEEKLLSLLIKIPQIQRETVDLILTQIVQHQSWPVGASNSLLIQLAYSEELVALQTLTDIGVKMLQAGQETFAHQIWQLLPDQQPYKGLVSSLLQVQKRVNSKQPKEVLSLSRQLLREKGIPPFIKNRIFHLFAHGLYLNGKYSLAQRVCERNLRHISPEDDCETWLAFKLTLCHLDIIAGRMENAKEHFFPLRRVINALHSPYYEAKIEYLQGEYNFCLGKYADAQNHFQASLQKYDLLRHHGSIQELTRRITETKIAAKDELLPDS